MVLPDGDFRAAKKDILSSFRGRVIFLDLNLDNVARVLNDFADICLVFSTNLSHSPLAEVKEAPNHPELPENANTITERWAIRLYHAESTVKRPEEEKYEEEMVRIPLIMLIICPYHTQEFAVTKISRNWPCGASP